VPEIIDPVFAKTSQNARFLLSENERFGLVFVKTGSINSGTDLVQNMLILASLGTNWYENERFGLFFTKMLVFMPKSGSINSGTGKDKKYSFFIHRKEYVVSAWKYSQEM
jgi:hypothetical protein